MDTKGLHELFYAFWDAGIMLSFGRDCVTNIPRDSDPDARVGRGKKGFSLGYQSLFLVDIEGFPLGHVESPLNVNEKQLVDMLLLKVLGESMVYEGG